MLKPLFKFFYIRAVELTWDIVLLIIGLHLITSYGLLTVAGEQFATFNDFVYFWIVTSSTVGYGDVSPSSALGKVTVYLWMIPGGIGIFGLLLGKTTTHFSNKWRKKMRGLGDYSTYQDHIVILGWHGPRTNYMIELILGDVKRDTREIVLCTKKDIENPLPEKVKFVKGESLTDDDLLYRSGIKTASKVIVLGEDDNQTLTAALTAYTYTREDDGRTEHIVAYFEKESVAKMFRKHCPTAECIVSMSVEMLVRAAQDPGSSRIQKQLLSTLSGPTQFSLIVPDDFSDTYGSLFAFFKKEHDATLLGVAATQLGDNLHMNAPSSERIRSGNILYFMSPERIKSSDVSWDSISSSNI